MNNTKLIQNCDNRHLAKIILAAALGAYFTATLSACGLTAGDKFVVGTTGFLAEVNRRGEPLGQQTDSERAELAKMIRRF